LPRPPTISLLRRNDEPARHLPISRRTDFLIRPAFFEADIGAKPPQQALPTSYASRHCRGCQTESVKLTVRHEIDKPESKLIEAVSVGWPAILSSLKSLLETGEPLEETRRWPKGKGE
jgi:hypothetical protein